MASFASGTVVSPFSTKPDSEDVSSASNIPSLRSGTHTIPIESMAWPKSGAAISFGAHPAVNRITKDMIKVLPGIVDLHVLIYCI